MCLQSPRPNNIRLVHWEGSITISDQCYQLCPLREANDHMWSLLPVLSTGRPQSPHLITATSFVHWQTSISISDHCYQFCLLREAYLQMWSLVPVCPQADLNHHIWSVLPVFFLLREAYHQMWSLLPVLSTERLHSPNLITATSVVHWETPFS